MGKAVTLVNQPNNVQNFYPADDNWEMKQFPFVASTAIDEGTLVAPQITSNDVKIEVAESLKLSLNTLFLNLKSDINLNSPFTLDKDSLDKLANSDIIASYFYENENNEKFFVFR